MQYPHWLMVAGAVLVGARISRFVFRRKNAEPDQEPMENEAKGK